MNQELQKLIANLPADFFGTVEIGVQNGIAVTARVTQTYKLSTSRGNRDSVNGNTR
jgi:hypothetical protein